VKVSLRLSRTMKKSKWPTFGFNDLNSSLSKKFLFLFGGKVLLAYL